MRKFLRRARLPVPRARPALATTVYSDRYFRYGLPLNARFIRTNRLVFEKGTVLVRQMSFETKHHIPLRSMPLLSRAAGVLYHPKLEPNSERSLRILKERRLPNLYNNKVIIVESTLEPFAVPQPECDEWRRPTRDLQYRQPLRGWLVSGKVKPSTPPKPLTPRSRPSSIGATPQFALAEGKEIELPNEETYESVYLTRSALAKRSPHISAVNVARGDIDKLYEKAGTARKVLNTERYNNGSWAPLVSHRRGSGAAKARKAKAVRGAIRALLAANGAFYALALITFYFLSLA
ncbi:hypothetical protein O0L34_g14321 [Tuta absoluta]|nr:hypothetical protein O0L34_g14321 [Tuta absoluta]